MPLDHRIRVVFDCSVFARVLISPKGPAGECLSAAQRGEIQLFVSEFVLQEIRELPGKVKPKRGVTADRVELLIQDLAKYAEPQHEIPVIYSHPKDPDDSHYVNLAHACRANQLLTNDEHLLGLMNRATADGREFVRQFAQIQIVTPETFLPSLRHELERIRRTGR